MDAANNGKTNFTNFDYKPKKWIPPPDVVALNDGIRKPYALKVSNSGNLVIKFSKDRLIENPDQ